MALATSLIVPAAASASVITGSAGVRPCVTTSNAYCSSIGTFKAKTNVTMLCWIDGSSATGAYTSKRWFLVRRSDGYEGFVHSSWVDNQTEKPNCSTSLRVRAGLETIKRLGQTHASSSDASLFASSAWEPGDRGEWSGDCKKLVYVAYYRAGRKLVSGNAWPTFDYYWKNGSERGGDYPRYGSLVGFKTYMPYGHIAVAVGGNRIATTQGTDDQKLKNAMLSTSSFSKYAGWAIPR